jgi:hypothetical protein
VIQSGPHKTIWVAEILSAEEVSHNLIMTIGIQMNDTQCSTVDGGPRCAPATMPWAAAFVPRQDELWDVRCKMRLRKTGWGS